MSKVLKNIAVFSLWFAGFVIIAHLVIPHDHHSDSFDFNKENTCHSENTKLPVKTPAFPIHCNALNDLTFEKASPNFLIYNNFPTCDLFTVSFFESVISTSDLQGIKIKDYQKPILKTDFLRLSPFRAPPSFV